MHLSLSRFETKLKNSNFEKLHKIEFHYIFGKTSGFSRNSFFIKKKYSRFIETKKLLHCFRRARFCLKPVFSSA